MGLPINPQFPTSVSRGEIPVHPSLMRPWRTREEAYQAWRDAQLRGGGNVLPLSAYLDNVEPAAGGGAIGGSRSSENLIGGRRVGRGTTTTELPPEVRGPYQEWINRISGISEETAGETRAAAGRAEKSLMPILQSPGFSKEEIGRINISPEEEEAYITESGRPSAGAAERSRQNLLRYTNAAGSGTGVSATMERIQQEYGRQAADAAIQMRLGILNQRREAARTTGEARQRQQEFAAGESRAQAGQTQQRELTLGGQGVSLIASYPERTTGTTEDVQTGPLIGGITGPGGGKPSWMSDRQWRDYQTKNPGVGTTPTPRSSGSLMPRLP